MREILLLLCQSRKKCGHQDSVLYDKTDSRKRGYTALMSELAQTLAFYPIRSWILLFKSERLGKNTTRRLRWTQTSEQNCLKFPSILE